MSKDISSIKFKHAMKFENFILNPGIINRNLIQIERFKNDPGAVYISIRTTGGVIALLRYAYEGKALENMSKDSVVEGFKLTTASDTLKVVLGNFKHDEKIEKGSGDLIDTLFEVLSTCEYQMTPHTYDGFMMLMKREYGPYSSRSGFCPEKDENYAADIQVECFHIRERDEAIIALISAINLWGKRVGVNFNVRYYRERYDVRPAVARELYTNSGMLELFDMMEKMHMCPVVLDNMSNEMAYSIISKDSGFPRWKVFGAGPVTDDEDAEFAF